MELPADNFILVSYLNTELRDNYSSLEELCEDLDLDIFEVTARTNACGFEYDSARNRFSAK